jgi:hypothetical protein
MRPPLPALWCGMDDANPQTFWELMLSLAAIYPFQCQCCGYVFGCGTLGSCRAEREKVLARHGVV